MKNERKKGLLDMMPRASQRITALAWLVVCLGAFLIITSGKYQNLTPDNALRMSATSSALNMLLTVLNSALYLRWGLLVLAVGLAGILAGRIVRRKEDT